MPAALIESECWRSLGVDCNLGNHNLSLSRKLYILTMQQVWYLHHVWIQWLDNSVSDRPVWKLKFLATTSTVLIARIKMAMVFVCNCSTDLQDWCTKGLHQHWLKIQVRNLNSTVICTAYGPPDTPLSCFDTNLTANFISASAKNLPTYINCNLLNKEGQHSQALTICCHSYNLSQLIKTSTNSSHRILKITFGCFSGIWYQTGPKGSGHADLCQWPWSSICYIMAKDSQSQDSVYYRSNE